MKPCVYRIHDADGALLYIGSTENLARRIQMHFDLDTTCADPVALRAGFASLSVEYHDELMEARRAEKAAIRAEAPLLNRHYNPTRWRWTGRAWIEAAA